MVNKSGQKGTMTESAVVKVCRDHGYKFAKRTAKTGAKDTSDVTIDNNLIAQVKGGAMGERASAWRVAQWWEETVLQAIQYSEMYGNVPVRAILVVKRKGSGVANAGDWHCYFKQRMTIDGPLLRTTLSEYLVESLTPIMYEQLVLDPLVQGEGLF